MAPTIVNPTPTWSIWKREHSCAPDDNSPACAKPSGGDSQGLPIGLGVGIPLGIAAVVLVFLHFKHVRKLKREEEQNKDLDVDMDDYDPNTAQGAAAAAATAGGIGGARNNSNDSHDDYGLKLPNGLKITTMEKAGSVAGSGSSATRRDSYDSHHHPNSDDPFYAAPYISHPDVNGSKTSLDEYSRSLHSVYDSSHSQQYPTSLYSNGVTPSFMVGGSSAMANNRPTDSIRSGSRQSNLSYSGRSMASNPSRLNVNVPNGSNTALRSPLTPTTEKEKSPFSSTNDSDNDDGDTSDSGNDDDDDDDDDDYEQTLHHNHNDHHNDDNDNDSNDRWQRRSRAPQVADFDFTPTQTPRHSTAAGLGQTPQAGSAVEHPMPALHDDYDQHDAFVIADEADEDDQMNEKRNSGLNRSDTKHFDRVKSIYKEYGMKEEPVGELPSRQAPEEHHEPPNTDFTGELPSRLMPEEHHEPPAVHHPSPPREEGSLEPSALPLVPPQPRQHPDQITARYPSPPYSDKDQESLPEQVLQPPAPVESVAAANTNAAGDYPTPPLQFDHKRMPPQQYHQQHHDHSLDESMYSGEDYYPTHPDEPFMNMPRNHPSNGSEYSSMTDSDRPFPPSISQQGRRSAQPLPKLTNLASPHQLDEFSSPIAFAPKARRKHHQNPQMMPASPVMASSNNSSSSVLPSPHALRQSVVMMGGVDFAPPKKFTNGGGSHSAGHSRSGSKSNTVSPPSSAYQSPYASARGSYDNVVPPRSSNQAATKQRDMANLVPDAKDSDMLRPTMDMRS